MRGSILLAVIKIVGEEHLVDCEGCRPLSIDGADHFDYRRVIDTRYRSLIPDAAREA